MYGPRHANCNHVNQPSTNWLESGSFAKESGPIKESKLSNTTKHHFLFISQLELGLGDSKAATSR